MKQALASVTRTAGDPEHDGEGSRFGQLLGALVSRTPDGLLFVDDEGRVEFSNAAFCRLIGADGESLRGATIEEIEARLKARSDPGMPWPALAELRIWSAAYQGQPTNGMIMQEARDRQWLVLTLPQETVLERRRLDLNPPPGAGSLFIFRDITQEARVSRTKSDFVSAAAHEIRTPLSTVVGFSELLKTGVASQTEAAEYGALIHRHAMELTNLLDELLDLSRIEASGMRAFRYGHKALGPLVEFLLAGYGQNEQRRRIVVSNTCPDAFELFVDAEKLMQALRNILNNALKYSPSHAVVDLQLAPFVQAGDLLVRIQVTDRGIGIADADLPRIFMPFSRGSNAQHLPGTGLGLSLAKDIIRNHGGTVSIDSTLGQGTTVTVVLPTTEKQHESALQER
jgi:signal transduction histidine kinase